MSEAKSAVNGVRTWVQHNLWDVVPRDHRQTTPALRRRQIVAGVFVVVGAVVLGLSLRIAPGNALFYPATIGLAAVWVVGAVVSGPLHLGQVQEESGLERPIMSPLVVGVGLAAVFVVGSLVLHDWDFARNQVRGVIDHADQGSIVLLVIITAVNGVAEELFFRGALYAAITRYPTVFSTLLYGVATLATGNVLLAVAALILGAVTATQRRASGGILAPMITHVVWSAAMLFLLPLIFFGHFPG